MSDGSLRRVRFAAAASALVVAALLGAPAVSTAGQITESSCPGGCGTINDIAPGIGGNVWFAMGGWDEATPSGVGYITPAGAVNPFLVPDTGAHIQGITEGPDGNMWFTDQGQPSASSPELPAIGKVTLAGAISEHTIPGASCTASACSSVPATIVSGPQGDLWFIDQGGSGDIGSATPSGVVSEYNKTSAFLGIPAGLTQGPGGVLFFGACRPAIDHVAPDGTIPTGPLLPCSGSSSDVQIAIPSDGRVWFINLGGTSDVYEADPYPNDPGGFQTFALPLGPRESRSRVGVWMSRNWLGAVGREGADHVL